MRSYRNEYREEPKPLFTQMIDAYETARFWWRIGVIGVACTVIPVMMVSKYLSNAREEAARVEALRTPTLEEVLSQPQKFDKAARQRADAAYGNSKATIRVRGIPTTLPGVKEYVGGKVSGGKPVRWTEDRNGGAVEIAMSIREWHDVAARCNFLHFASVDSAKVAIVYDCYRKPLEAAVTENNVAAAFDKELIDSCVAEGNKSVVREMIRKHTLDRVVIVEIENRYRTKELGDLAVKQIAEARVNVAAANRSRDGRTIEVVCAPADFRAVVAVLAKHHPTKLNPALQRLACRPDAEARRIEIDTENDKKALVSFRSDIESGVNDSLARLRKLRVDNGREQVATIIVLASANRKSGGIDVFAIYERLKKQTRILGGGQATEKNYAVFVASDDLAALVGMLGFAGVARVDDDTRTIVVDPDPEHAKLHSPVDGARKQPAAIVTVDLEDWDRLELSEKYGAQRVAQAILTVMPTDKAEREYIRRVACEGYASVRVYDHGYYEHYLVAPVDDYKSFVERFAFTKPKSNLEAKQTYEAQVDPGLLRRVMGAKSK